MPSENKVLALPAKEKEAEVGLGGAGACSPRASSGPPAQVSGSRCSKGERLFLPSVAL